MVPGSPWQRNYENPSRNRQIIGRVHVEEGEGPRARARRGRWVILSEEGYLLKVTQRAHGLCAH